MTRFLHSIRHELTIQYRNILIASGAVAGSMMLLGLLSWLGGVSPINLWDGYQLAMLVIGVLISSGQFGELRSPGHRIAYLLRPSTVWEKVGAKIAVSTLFVWLAVTVSFVLTSLFSALLYMIVAGGAGAGKAFVAAFAGGDWMRMSLVTLRVYLPLNAVFLFGSVYFRKHPVGRTLLSLVGWIASYVVIGAVAVRLIFGRYIEGSYPGAGSARALGFHFGPGESFSVSSEMWHQIAPFYLQRPDIMEPIVTTAVVLGFWLLAVLRLRETEA